MFRSKKMSLILLTAIFSISAARYSYAVGDDPSKKIEDISPSLDKTDNISIPYPGIQQYTPRENDIIFDGNDTDKGTIQNINIPSGVVRQGIIIDTDKLIVDKITTDKKTKGQKAEFIFNKQAKLILNASDIKNIKCIDLQKTASSIIINNTNKANSEIEDIILASDTSNLPSGSSQSISSLPGATKAGVSSTLKRINPFKPDTLGEFDLSLLSSSDFDHGIIKNGDNATIHVVGKSKTDNILTLSSDIHLYGHVDLDQVVNTKAKLDSDQTHGIPKTITIHAINSNDKYEPGELVIRSTVMANILAKDDSKIITDGSSNIIFNRFGQEGDELIQTIIKDKSQLTLQADATATQEQEINMYNHIVAEASSYSLGQKDKTKLFFFDPGNGSSVTYNVYGHIGTESNYFPQILLHERSTLNVKNGIYANKLKLSFSEKNKGALKKSSSTNNLAQLPMPDAGASQSVIIFNRNNYIKHLKTIKPNHGKVIVRGEYDDSQENSKFVSKFQGDIGTISSPLYSIEFEEQHTPDDNPSYINFVMSSLKGGNSVFLADGLTFTNKRDELSIEGKYKINGDIKWSSKVNDINLSTASEAIGNINITNDSQLDFFGNIGTYNNQIDSIKLGKNSRFNGESPKDHMIDLKYYAKKFLMETDSNITLSRVSLHTNIIPKESGHGSIRLQNASFVGNIGDSTKNVNSIVIADSGDSGMFNQITGNVHTENYTVSHDMKLLGNHSVHATTPNNTGAIKIGKSNIMIGKHQYILEGDKVEIKGFNSSKHYNSRIPKGNYSIFHVGYEVDDYGAIENYGKLIIKQPSNKWDKKNKIIVHINRSNKDDIIKHNANTKFNPVEIANLEGNILDNVYICDEKCRWSKGDDGEFFFDGLLDTKSKKKHMKVKSSTETIDSDSLAAEKDADDILINSDMFEIPEDASLERSERDVSPEDSVLLADTPYDADDSVVDKGDTEDDVEMIEQHYDQQKSDNSDNQSSTPQRDEIKQFIMETSQEEDKMQSDDGNDVSNNDLDKFRQHNIKHHNVDNYNIVNRDIQRIRDGYRHHNTSKMRSQHAITGALNTKIGSRLFQLGDSDSSQEVIGAGADIVRNIKLGVWADGFTGRANFKSEKEGDKSSKTSIGGFTIGADAQFNDNFILGGAFSYSKIGTKIGKDTHVSSDNSAHIFSIYSQLSLDMFVNSVRKPFVQGIMNIIKHNITPYHLSNSKQVKGTAYGASGFNASMMLGYPFAITDSRRLILVPMAGIRHSSFTTPSHTITYDDTSEKHQFEESKHSLTEGIIGLSIKYLQHIDVMTGSYSTNSETYAIDTKSINIVPEAHIFGHLNFNNSMDNSTSNNDASDRIHNTLRHSGHLGIDLPSSSLQLGGKITVKVSRFEVGGSIDGYFASNYNAYVGAIHLKVNF